VNGLLIVDKPEGMTSFDVVAVLRRTLKTQRAGHTGTLDPMATGVLPVCLGEATKLVPFILEGDKTYEAAIRLGACTDTQDRTGKVIAEAPVPPTLTRDSLEQVLARFRGEIDQAPPMYSAIRVDGKRLYELAREGKEVARAARRVTVHELEVLDFAPPDLRVRVRCSKGTYVRTLGHDLGEALGCHAHLTALRRTESAGFSIDQAVTLDVLSQLARTAPEALAARLLTPARPSAPCPPWSCPTPSSPGSLRGSGCPSPSWARGPGRTASGCAWCPRRGSCWPWPSGGPQDCSTCACSRGRRRRRRRRRAGREVLVDARGCASVYSPTFWLACLLPSAAAREAPEAARGGSRLRRSRTWEAEREARR
jgi:tRNA pseudouridine55 synthase